MARSPELSVPRSEDVRAVFPSAGLFTHEIIMLDLPCQAVLTRCHQPDSFSENEEANVNISVTTGPSVRRTAGRESSPDGAVRKRGAAG